ncbi:hypothetical protein EXIGLDRAFT_201972 [Exidia glandulosa HHB12029]|uniref:Uncharacterized protein n=1 Tax=Exidia glandulosa HHB12029 TaxID=1314781 RepID=A0A165EPS8_EXIGL|nr:hypothetical protein EXIGLDRAFT_201972 [Exidia glandulosa HHB12029]
MRSKCRTDARCRLWNNENWKYLPPKFWLTKLVSWLKGPLIQNPHERALIKHFLVGRGPIPRKRGEPRTQKPGHFIDTERDITLERVLDVLHDLRCFLVPGDRFYDMLAKDKFGAVKSGDLLCDRCLEELVQNRLWVWWATVKSTMGKVCGNEPDCPYVPFCSSPRVGG